MDYPLFQKEEVEVKNGRFFRLFSVSCMLFCTFAMGVLFGYSLGRYGTSGTLKDIGLALGLFFNPWNLITGLIVVAITAVILKIVYRKEINEYSEKMKLRDCSKGG